MNLISYLEKFEIPTDTLVNATTFVDSMDPADASLLAALFAVEGVNPILTAKYICNAVLKGENDLARVQSYVSGRVKAAGQAVVKDVPVVYSAPVIVEVAPEPVVTVTVEPAPAAVEEASQEAPEAVSVEPATLTPVIEAKRGRGRPRLAETAYDRAVKVMQGLPKHDTKTVIEALVASGVKKSSAHVYLCEARKSGVITRA